VASPNVRSGSHFSPAFACGPLHCRDHWPGRSRFQPPPPRTVHAVLPHTAHRRRSPAAFGFPRQSRKGLGATTIPDKVTSPRRLGEANASTHRPNAWLRRWRLLMNGCRACGSGRGHRRRSRRFAGRTVPGGPVGPARGSGRLRSDRGSGRECGRAPPAPAQVRCAHIGFVDRPTGRL